jgi:putative FmdB family regulatory protein
MPTYDYKCTTCEKTFELFQSITAKPFRKYECPACGAVRSVRRLIGTGGGVIFKGSGFYQTDYRSKTYQKAAKADTEAVSAPASDTATASATSSPAAASTTTKPATEKPAADKTTGEKKTKAKPAATSTSK